MFLGNAILLESPVKSRDSRIASIFGMLFLGILEKHIPFLGDSYCFLEKGLCFWETLKEPERKVIRYEEERLQGKMHKEVNF